MLNSVGDVGSVRTWVVCGLRVKFWHGWRGWPGCIKFWCRSNIIILCRDLGVDVSKLWHRWPGSMKFWHWLKCWCRSKTILFTSVPFHSIVSVSYLHLLLTFISFHSLCSIRIQIGMGLKSYTDLNPAYYSFTNETETSNFL